MTAAKFPITSAGSLLVALVFGAVADPADAQCFSYGYSYYSAPRVYVAPPPVICAPPPAFVVYPRVYCEPSYPVYGSGYYTGGSYRSYRYGGHKVYSGHHRSYRTYSGPCSRGFGFGFRFHR